MFSDLNPRQKEAACAGDEPLLIVAGAGSGKTKTLTARLAYMITERGIEPERIVAITFTNKAAHEMRERVKALAAKHNIQLSKEPFLGTFHGFGASILRAEGSFFKRNRAFSIYDSDDSLRTVKKILKGYALDKSKTPAYFLKEISRIKSELLTSDRYLSDPNKEIVWVVYEQYEAALEASNAFDFDDLIQKVVLLFEWQPAILAKYQVKYSHVLVDEYQDINTAQYRMLRLLVQGHDRLSVVGDDAQAIYKFRFSDFRNFLNFEKDWPSAKVVLLEQNYRSTRTIIESSSSLIARNAFQKHKELWTANDEGSPVLVKEHENGFLEADYIVHAANELACKGMHVGILYRTNAQSRALEQMFLEYGIEYQLFGALSFYERKEVKDIVAALRYACNPKDEASLARLEKNFLKKTYTLLKEELPAKAQTLKPAELIEYFLQVANFAELLKKDYTNYQERLENVYELAYFAKQFDKLEDFLEKVSLSDAFEARGSKHNKSRHDAHSGISMMTIHLAKGLEFDAVFVAGVNEGILPHQRSMFSPDDVEEERRLLYVAMTRARKELILNFYDAPSHFLYELPPDKVLFDSERPLDDEERYIEYD